SENTKQFAHTLADNLEKRISFLEEEVRRFKSLLEIGRAFQSEMDIDNLLPLIIERTSAGIGAERCSVFVYNPDKGILWTKIAQNSKPIIVPAGQGIIGWVLENNKPLLIPDAYSDPRFDSSIDAKTGYRTNSIAALPLLDRRGRPLGVFEAINKPNGEVFDEDDLDFLQSVAAQISAALENAMLYTQLLKTFESFLDVMAFTIDAKHPIARGHSRRVAIYSKGIAKEMGLSQESVDKIYWAALLHDYGKISVPDAILQKAGKLTEDEYEQIKRHALMTYRILSRIHFARHLRDIPLIASEHHERWDGKGYPFGKKNDQIPLGARIIAIADVFDALTSFREYHSPMTFAEAREEIISLRGTSFDPKVVDAFIRYYDRELDPYKLRKTLWRSMGK
ncbi:HD domain-containing protein, partial [bacterium]|nr:HD domain-containing protein [bacterium]